MKRLSGLRVLACGLVAWPCLAWAKTNEDIIKQVEATGAGKFVLPVLVVVLAAVALAGVMFRRAR